MKKINANKSKLYNFALLKAYFDTGYGVTSYLKYMIALFGITSLDIKVTLIIGFIYGVFCFVFGYFWFYSGMKAAEQEVNNRYNYFVGEVRKTINTTKRFIN